MKVKGKYFLISIFTLFFVKGMLTLVLASVVNPEFSDQNLAAITTSLKGELSKGFNHAEIEFTGPVQWIRNTGLSGSKVSTVLLGTDFRGNAHFSVTEIKKNGFTSASAEGWIGFAAWALAKIAVKRIHPGELLNPSMFLTRKINLSYGQAYDYRGLIYPADSDVGGMEAIQTILEGQFLVSSAMQRIPDVRRGDSVRVNIISEGLTLSTIGVAEEPGYINKQIRVMTGKSKKELLGRIRSEGIVEVKL